MALVESFSIRACATPNRYGSFTRARFSRVEHTASAELSAAILKITS